MFFKSILYGTANSIAADGVGALTSQTKSAIVKSVSWPTEEMMWIADSKIDRETISSLKFHFRGKEHSTTEIFNYLSDKDKRKICQQFIFLNQLIILI